MSAPTGRKLPRRTRELHALTEVAKTLTVPLTLSELLQAVMNTLTNVLDSAERGVIMLWDQSSGLFRSEAAFGFDLAIMREMGLRAGESITGKVYDDGRPRLLTTGDEVEQAMADMRPANRAVRARAIGVDRLPCGVLAVPLRIGERRFGVLMLETVHRPVRFKTEDMPFVQTLADLIALAIDRARLADETEAIRDSRQVDRLRSEVMATLSHEPPYSAGRHQRLRHRAAARGSQLAGRKTPRVLTADRR